MLRHKPADNSATIRINRLKDKLAVRSMPTGEVTFENTEAFLVAGENEGFKQMAEMLNLSRLYNAVASVAGMRRAVLEALKYGAGRRAFGHRLDELPLWRAAMEAIGGNAYIEESILPRLLRDCQVLPIWEGTTHIQTLDALRAIQKEGSQEALFARIKLALAGAKKFDIGPVNARLDDDIRRLDTLLKLPAELQQREARQWLERVGRTLTLALLLLESAAHPPLREACLAAYQRLAVRPTGVMPVGNGNPAELVETETVLLRCATR